MSLVLPSDFNDYGGSGTFSSADLQLAIDLAENEVENVISTFLQPTTLTEEYLWPLTDGKILLNHGKVTSITEVIAKHSLDSNCVWTEDTECGVILNGIEGLVKVVGCHFTLGNDCNCINWTIPDRLVITYVAGYTAAETAANTKVGKTLRMAIILRAREWLQALLLGGDWEGTFNVKGWSSMDYSEQRKYADVFASSLGIGPLGSAAYTLLNNIRGKPAIFLRGSGKY